MKLEEIDAKIEELQKLRKKVIQNQEAQRRFQAKKKEEKMERTEIEKIKNISKKLGVEIEIYTSEATTILAGLHTDNCTYVDDSIDNYTDNDIEMWDVVSAEDYNSTIYANCGEVQKYPVIVVLLKR